jgi:hypothetical protein
MGFFDKINRSSKFTVIYLTPSSKFIIALASFMLVILSFIAFDYTKTKNQGERFTKEDGIALHISIEEDLTMDQIDSIYLGKQTFFRTYLEEKAKK